MTTAHNRDIDCAGHIDADGTCGICGVYHGAPCALCGGRGFHIDGCIGLIDRSATEHLQAMLEQQVQAIIEGAEYDLTYLPGYIGRGMNGKTSPFAFETTISPGNGHGQQLRALGLQVDALGLSWVYYVGVW